jgi:hypothetical protein
LRDEAFGTILAVMTTASPSTKKRGTDTKKHGRVGPYSRLLRYGPIGKTVDGRSAIGRLMRDLEKQLVEHLGHPPSIVEKLLIDRLVRLRCRLQVFEAKYEDNSWTDLDRREYGALHNAFRLTARDLGIRAAPPPEPVAPKPQLTLEELLAAAREERSDRR